MSLYFHLPSALLACTIRFALSVRQRSQQRPPKSYLTSVERKPHPSLEAMRNIQRLMALHNPKVAGVRVEELIEPRFIRKLDESGYIEKVSATYGK